SPHIRHTPSLDSAAVEAQAVSQSAGSQGVEWFRPLLRYAGSAGDGRNWLALVYQFIRLPLAFVYALLWTVGIAVGTSLAVVVIGILALAFFLFVVWGCGKFERGLLTWWLRVPLLPQRAPLPQGRGFWRRLRDF